MPHQLKNKHHINQAAFFLCIITTSYPKLKLSSPNHHSLSRPLLSLSRFSSMEGYSSIFSSSTNSASSSSTNFPFSLSHNSFDGDYQDHHHQDLHDHHGGDQNGQLIGMMMMDNQQHQQQQQIMVQDQQVFSNNHQINGHVSSNHVEDQDNYVVDNKGMIMMGKDDDDDDHNKMMMKKKGSSEISNNKKVRKHRYAFQTRSQVDILDDGYRWRKYGQKAVKNNVFPRSYYRCTHQGCNVKKQVQRLSKDEGVVVTTYEGIHSHSIEKSTDNFEHILSQMHIYNSF